MSANLKNIVTAIKIFISVIAIFFSATRPNALAITENTRTDVTTFDDVEDSAGLTMALP